MATTNDNLHKAKAAKNDEWYTRYEDIEAEIQHYDLRGKWVYSPCDDYRVSNFVAYFKDHYEELGLTHYTATNYNIGNGAWRYDFDGETETIAPLQGNGDFRSEECTAIKDDCDIVISNPPFSLWRAFIDWLRQDEKEEDTLF